MKGLFLTFLLLSMATLLSGIHEQQNRSFDNPYADIPRVETTPHSWDFSSGLSLSQSFADQADEILYISTEAFRVNAVTGQSDNIEVTCEPEPCDDSIFAFASESIIYYDYNTSNIAVNYNTESQEWNVRILRLLSNSVLSGEIFYELHQVPIRNISDALIHETAGIEDLQIVSEDVYGQMMRENIDVGDLEFTITHAYSSGYYIRIELYNNHLFMQVSRFDKYYSSRQIIGFERNDSHQNQYYVGSLDIFFPIYKQAVNNLLDVLIGG